MQDKAKELIKQLAAELEFVTLPAMDPAHHHAIGYGAEIVRNNYEAAKDLKSDLKKLYKILDNNTIY